MKLIILKESLFVSDVVEFDFCDEVPHAACNQESVSSFPIGNAIEEVVLVVTTAPHIILVQNQLLLAALQNR